MTALERARSEVDECKRQCREAFDGRGSPHPLHVFFQCHEYHRRVGLLREAEARLRAAERGVAA